MIRIFGLVPDLRMLLEVFIYQWINFFCFSSFSVFVICRSLHGDKRAAKSVRISCWRAVVQRHGDFDVKRMMDLLLLLISPLREQLQSTVRCSFDNLAHRRGWLNAGGARRVNGVLLSSGAFLENRSDSFDASQAWSHSASDRGTRWMMTWPTHRKPSRMTAATCPTDRERLPRICTEPNEDRQSNPKSRRT